MHAVTVRSESTHILISDYFIHVYGSQITVLLSNEFNSASAAAMLIPPKGHTKLSSVDTTQASAPSRLTVSPLPFILAHDISRGPVVFVIASINALFMVMVM